MVTELSITLEEAFKGTKKTLNIRRGEVCKNCKGKGGRGIKRCSSCHGEGFVRHSRRTMFGVFAVQSTCSRCKGSGEDFEETCPSCKGKGMVFVDREIEVQVPRGVDNGTKLRLSGLGEELPNGRPGDLYVVVRVLPHDRIKRVGNDLFVEQPISFATACLGGTVEARVFSSSISLKIPPGTSSNTEFRIKGKGMRGLDGSTGDLVLNCVVEVPKTLTKRQKELLKEFEKD